MFFIIGGGVCGKTLGWTNRDKTRTKPAPTPRLPASAEEPIFFLFLLLPDYRFLGLI